MREYLAHLYQSYFGASVIVAPEYLLLCLPIAYLAYRLTANCGGFWHWLTPREVYLHRSHRLDLMLFALGRFLVFLGLAGRISLATATALAVARVFDRPALGNGLSPWLLALLLWLVSDLATYWMHRLHHHIRLLWQVHAVHHSAEVLTPFTAYRQHPLTLITTVLPGSVLVGLAQGLLIGTLDPGAAMLEVAGVNAFVVIANAAMANFQHSHIWISFGPVLERLIISPAQHQIHHSKLLHHYDRNFGQTLAVWDWIFGTLYVIHGHENLTYGVSEEDLAPLSSHGFWTTLWHPLRQMAHALRQP